jgi:hypothetical protein
MEQSTAQRRLVKSPPELWAEISNEANLGRHLAEFGEIRITRADAETTVAWEGDRASGTVELAPAGWGTKVVLTATPVAEEAAAAPVAAERDPEPEPDPQPDPAPVAAAPDAPRPAPLRARCGLLARLLRRWRPPRPAAEIPAPGPPVHDPSPPPPGPDPAPPDPGPPPSPTPPPPDPVPPAPDPGPPPGPPPPDPVPPAPYPEPTPPPAIEAPAPPPAAELDPDRIVAVLTQVLDDLGAAHHRATYFAPLT